MTRTSAKWLQGLMPESWGKNGVGPWEIEHSAGLRKKDKIRMKIIHCHLTFKRLLGHNY